MIQHRHHLNLDNKIDLNLYHHIFPYSLVLYHIHKFQTHYNLGFHLYRNYYNKMNHHLHKHYIHRLLKLNHTYHHIHLILNYHHKHQNNRMIWNYLNCHHTLQIPYHRLYNHRHNFHSHLLLILDNSSHYNSLNHIPGYMLDNHQYRYNHHINLSQNYHLVLPYNLNMLSRHHHKHYIRLL